MEGLQTVQHAENLRYLDAHEGSNGNRVVTRGRQKNQGQQLRRLVMRWVAGSSRQVRLTGEVIHKAGKEGLMTFSGSYVVVGEAMREAIETA